MPEFYTGKVGIERHPNLLDRNLPDQHPIEAISGLAQMLSDNETDKTNIGTRIGVVETDLSTHKADKDNPHEVKVEQIKDGQDIPLTDLLAGKTSFANLTTAIDNHNTEEEAHADIRQAIETNDEKIDEHKADKNNPHEVIIAQIPTLQDKLNAIDTALDGKANIDLDNISEAGEIVIRTIAQEESAAALDEAKEYTDTEIAEAIASSQLATQKWLAAVNTKADLPTAPDNLNTYLCRVISDGANNGVWQHIPNAADWTYFGDNADFVDEAELNTAINNHNTSNTAHSDIRTALNNHIGNTNNPHNVTKEQLGLGNISNTSDADKPISDAMLAALNNKVDKEAGKGLSTNDYTTAEKNKLAGIEAGAQVNIIESIKADGAVLPITNKQVDLGNLKRLLVRNESITSVVLSTAVKNTTYRYGTLASLTIGSFEDSNEEIIVQWYSGATPTALSLPSIPTINPLPVMAANNWYELSVLNGIMAISQGASI